MTVFFIFFIGLIVGSFLNVLIDRLPREESPWRGRSHCDHCHKILKPLDLIPIYSFLWLAGKCRYCKKRLSWQYPLVELATGFLFAGLFYWYSSFNFQLSTFNYILLVTLFSAFLVIFVADLKYQVIPDQMTVVTLITSLVYVLVLGLPIWTHFISGLSAFSFFLCLFLVTQGRGMGFGDVKLAFVIGFLLGFPKIVISLYLAFLTGAAISIILILWQRKHIKDRIAFGPFLIVGAVTSFFFGNIILSWYRIFIGGF